MYLTVKWTAWSTASEIKVPLQDPAPSIYTLGCEFRLILIPQVLCVFLYSAIASKGIIYLNCYVGG